MFKIWKELELNPLFNMGTLYLAKPVEENLTVEDYPNGLHPESVIQVHVMEGLTYEHTLAHFTRQHLDFHKGSLLQLQHDAEHVRVHVLNVYLCLLHDLPATVLGVHYLRDEVRAELFPEYQQALQEHEKLKDIFYAQHGTWRPGKPPMPKPPLGQSSEVLLKALWDRQNPNSPHWPYDANPWVWALEVKLLPPFNWQGAE